MWTSSLIRRHIAKLPDDRIFTTREMLNYGYRGAVDKVMYRLVVMGDIVRLAWGVFVKSTHPNISAITPAQVAAVKAAAFGRNMMTHGADAAHKLGLTASGHPAYVFNIDGRTSTFKFRRKILIRLKGTSARKILLGDDDLVGNIIRSLWQMRQAALHRKIIQTVSNLMDARQRRALFSSARWMPHWLSDYLFWLRHPGTTPPPANGRYYTAAEA